MMETLEGSRGLEWVRLLLHYLEHQPSKQGLANVLGEPRNSLRAINVQLKPKNSAIHSIVIEPSTIIVNLMPEKFGLTEKKLEQVFHQEDDISNQDDRILTYDTGSKRVRLQSFVHLGVVPSSGFIDELDFLIS